MAEDTAAIPSVNIDVAQERKKPRLEALLFCDYVAITTEKKAVLAGIFDKLTIQEDDRTVAFSLYIRTAETREPMQLSIFGPDNILGMVGMIRPQESLPDDEDKTLHIQMTVAISFEVPMEGIYWFDISYKGQSLGGNCFRVIMRKQGE